jgi:hypothetical protein
MQQEAFDEGEHLVLHDRKTVVTQRERGTAAAGTTVGA